MRLRQLPVALALAATACTPTSKCGPATGTVAEVVDGDTIVLNDGTKLRYLLVDAPEITSGKDDCYGQEAARFNNDALVGKTLQLAYDEAGCSDRFGRALAYVTVDGVELNAELVKRGLACTLYVAPSGGARREEFETYQSVAQTNRTGMWGACTSIPCSK